MTKYDSANRENGANSQSEDHDERSSNSIERRGYCASFRNERKVKSVTLVEARRRTWKNLRWCNDKLIMRSTACTSTDVTQLTLRAPYTDDNARMAHGFVFLTTPSWPIDFLQQPIDENNFMFKVGNSNEK